MHSCSRTATADEASTINKRKPSEKADLPVPFLRWAGGKIWFARRYGTLLNSMEFNSYHEPFLGGGSVFFSLTTPRTAYLSDTNKELVETYLAIKDCPVSVISELAKFKNDKETYYKIRSTTFTEREKKSAQFIYLNKTSFNGVYRVNLKGQYNVPYGYRSKKLVDECVLVRASEALRNTVLTCCDFEQTIDKMHEGDLVFLDPPYTVSHNHNGFIKYNQKIFGLKDQYRLADFVARLCRKGCKYILTNASHPEVTKIFSAEGDPIEVSRASLVGGKKARRGHTKEYVFTNMEIGL